MRESQVEAHLKAVVKKLGGETRKVKWIGRNGAPDRLVMLPFFIVPLTLWVELKAPRKEAASHQAREHERLRALGQRVEVLDSIEAIDEYFKVDTRSGRWSGVAGLNASNTPKEAE